MFSTFCDLGRIDFGVWFELELKVWIFESLCFFGEDKESSDVLREQCSKEACERGGIRRLSDDILPHILNL